MATRYLRYRATLKSRARSLRREPTPAERKLWYEFLRDLPQRFTRQKPLGRYVADFYCSSSALVVEVDGDSHFTGAQPGHDALRTEELERMQLRVIRFSNADVMQHFEAVCGEISRALAVQQRP